MCMCWRWGHGQTKQTLSSRCYRLSLQPSFPLKGIYKFTHQNPYWCFLPDFHTNLLHLCAMRPGLRLKSGPRAFTPGLPFSVS